MSNLAGPITELINQLSRLPGVGEKTAGRLAFYLIQAPEALSMELSAAIVAARTTTFRCSECGNLTATDPCGICASPHRDPATLCVVESVSDVVAIEKSGEFRGRYHVLHGLIRPMEGVGPDQLNLHALLRRVGGGQVVEVIVATNPSVEGEATAMYLKGLLSTLGLRVTRIASGIPLGGELEYADRATLGRALSARVPLLG